MSLRASSIVVAIAALLAAPASSSEPHCHTWGARNDRERALNAARERWAAQKVTTYNYRFSRNCLCDQRTAGPFRVRVEDGVVRAAIYQGAAPYGIADGTRVEKEFLTSVATVDHIFDVIAGAIAKKACLIDVSYDAELGYPTKVEIDFDPETADEELHLAISDVRPAGGRPALASPRPKR